MIRLAQNLRYLRKKSGFTQAQLADKLGVKRSALGAYEEDRAEPKYATLSAIAGYFNVSVDALLFRDIENGGVIPADTGGKGLRILPVTVNDAGEETIPLVPARAQAGYTRGYGDAEYIGNLPQFSMPFPNLARDRTYRIFQTQGDSMLPVPENAYVITEYESDWTRVRSDECYVVLTMDDGIVFERVINHLESDGTLILKSDNPLYEPYSVHADQLLEIWKVLGYISFSLPEPGTEPKGLQEIRESLGEIKKDLRVLLRKN